MMGELGRAIWIEIRVCKASPIKGRKSANENGRVRDISTLSLAYSDRGTYRTNSFYDCKSSIPCSL